MPAALAFRYARALADLSVRPGSPVDGEAAMAELQAFERALQECQDLRGVLESPAIAPARKQAVMSRLAGMLPLSDLVRRFLLVVVDHRRVELLADVREAFEAVLDERLGLVRVDVTSARQLTPSQRQDLLVGLSRLTGKRTHARFALREDLIGGVVARVGSTVYDGSVRGQLQALKQRLAGTET